MSIDGKKMLGDRINIEFARGGRDRRDDFRNRDPDVRYFPLVCFGIVYNLEEAIPGQGEQDIV